MEIKPAVCQGLTITYLYTLVTKITSVKLELRFVFNVLSYREKFEERLGSRVV